jgi:hypothetical protein
MATKHTSRLWLACWRLGLLFLGLTGLLVTITGLVMIGSNLIGAHATKAAESWFFLFIAAFGLLFVAIAVKGWRVRTRTDLVELESAFRQRIDNLENRINR